MSKLPSQPLVADGPVLTHLPKGAVQEIQAHGWHKRWRRGQFVVRRGDIVHAVMVVIGGRLRASTVSVDGDENLLGWLAELEVFGVPNVLDGSPFAVNIIADSPAETLHVARDDFLSILQAYPDAAIGVAVALSRRLAQLFDVIDASGYRALTERVRAHLWRLARQHGKLADGRCVLEIAQSDLAAAVGASRQRVHAELRKLEADGEIELAYRKIILLGPLD